MIERRAELGALGRPAIGAATFGLAPDDAASRDVHPGHTLRVRLADRSLRQTNCTWLARPLWSSMNQ